MKAYPGPWTITTDDVAVWSVNPGQPPVLLASLNSDASPGVDHATSLATANIMSMSCDLARSLRDMVDAFICFTQWDEDVPVQVIRARELLDRAEPLLPEPSCG